MNNPSDLTETCSHRAPKRTEWQEIEVSPFGDTESQRVEVGGESTFSDISIGAFQCTQCGHVGFYTGHWQAFYVDNVPCLGSDHPQANLAEVRQAIRQIGRAF